ncbi:MAG: phosphate-starvation-inducible PsiE family protein [Pirellulales bacterium]|nr:phosphate-starvation-inducible PsiE family protein [Pirellulales bacterium]
MPGLGDSSEPLLKVLQSIIRVSVRVLAILMTVLILLGVVDVAWMLFEKVISSSPRFVLSIRDILATFGAFLAVLIAVEIFVNIIMYLREDVIHVKIVVATALMAIARKVIILDFKETSSDFIWATAGVILATSIAYWLVDKAEDVPGK